MLNETAILYAMGELRDAELAELRAWWRNAYETASDAAMRRELLKLRGAPPEIVKRWDDERKRRSKTIRKLARAGT